MNYKAVLLSLLTHAILFFAGWFANDYFNNDNSFVEEQIEYLQSQRDSLVTEIAVGEQKISLLKDLAGTQRFKIDSLEVELIKIKQLYRLKGKTIDSLIAKDSTNAIEQYRLALQNLGVIPDMSERLTLREIGYGAKFISEIPSINLQLSILEMTNKNYERLDSIRIATIAEYEKQEIKYDRLIRNGTHQTEVYRQAYENATRFWANRIIVYLGVGANYNETIKPGLQLGVGIKIWGNK